MTAAEHVLEISPCAEPDCEAVFWTCSCGDFGPYGWSCNELEARRVFRDHPEGELEHDAADREEFRKLMPFTIADIRRRIPADHPDQERLSRVPPPPEGKRPPDLHCRCGFVVPSGQVREMHRAWAEHLDLNPVTVRYLPPVRSCRDDQHVWRKGVDGG